MSYTPTEWHGGDVLSAEAMNKIENGIANAGSGALEVNFINDRLDKTWQEIYDAFPNVYIVINDGNFIDKLLISMVAYVDVYEVIASNGVILTCAESNDYPQHTVT